MNSSRGTNPVWNANLSLNPNMNQNLNQNQRQNQNSNLNPNQSQNPNQEPNPLLFHPHQPNPLYQPMTQQLNRFYESSVGNAIPANLGPVLPPYGNFNSAFNPAKPININGFGDAKGMFNNHGFVNRNDLLHNNLYDIILNEEIVEYSILVDSKDRNIEVYPNVWSYDVAFGPINTTRSKVNGKTVVYETPNPVVNQSICKVRYILLQDAILPFYSKIKNTKHTINGEECIIPKIDTTKNLTEYLYVVLCMDGYNDNRRLSTNDLLSESFGTIYYDGNTSNTHYSGSMSGAIKIFQPDQLGTIDCLKIRFYNPYGEPLSVNHFDKNIKSRCECNCDEDNNVINKDCPHHNLLHPLAPAWQHHLHFTIGVVEPRLNKRIFS